MEIKLKLFKKYLIQVDEEISAPEKWLAYKDNSNWYYNWLDYFPKKIIGFRLKRRIKFAETGVDKAPYPFIIFDTIE